MNVFTERALRLVRFGTLAAGTCLCACPLHLDDQIWCGMRWNAQLSGAVALDESGAAVIIPATDTTHSECLSVADHQALDLADANDAIYTALRDQIESAAIANCEQAGQAIFPDTLAYTTCSQTGTPPVSTNITYTGQCYDDVSNRDACVAKSDCIPLGDGQYLCNPSETGETDV